jgi:hypothetical protein
MNIARKTCGLVKEGKRRRTLGYTNKARDDTLQEYDVKFIKALRLRWYDHAERMKTEESQNKLQQLQ